jgi:hypothetical protein
MDVLPYLTLKTILAELTLGKTTYAILSAGIILMDWNMVVLVWRHAVLKNASTYFCVVSAGSSVSINYRL